MFENVDIYVTDVGFYLCSFKNFILQCDRRRRSAAFTMEYKRFLSVTTLLTVAVLTIYVGCLRSYAIYFFEVT